MDLNNPSSFNQGDLVESYYSHKIYRVVEPNKSGMATLLNVLTGINEKWNACNNAHFVKCEKNKQLNIFNYVVATAI